MQAVEPAPRLVDRLADKIGGEAPVLKQRFILKGIVVLGYGHGSGIEPAVDYLGNPPHPGPTFLTIEGQLIDKGSVQVQRLFEPGKARLILQFLHTTHALVVPAGLTAPDRQRRPPVPFAGESPVNIILQPVAEAPLLDVLRVPVYLVVAGDEVVLYRRGADIPGLLSIVEQRRFAAPAEGVGVPYRLAAEEQVLFLQLFEHLRVGVFNEFAGKRIFPDNVTLQVHGVDEVQLVFQPGFVVNLAVSRRHVHYPRPLLQRDKIGGDYPVGQVFGRFL
ncbi:hypothetical protein ES708_30478 [subsurface metagenome]